MDVIGGLIVLALSIASVALLPRLSTIRGRIHSAPALPHSTSAAYGD
jgi:hypothetical protein